MRDAPKYHGDVRSVEHFHMHLSKYVGELGDACEKMGHEAEAAEGRRKLRAWLEKRAPQVRRTLDLIGAVTTERNIGEDTAQDGVTYNKYAEQEDEVIAHLLRSAREVQEFLWAEKDPHLGVEECIKNLRKRLAKIEAITPDHPHWDVEMRKRLLQIGGLAVAYIAKIEAGDVTWERDGMPSQFEEYAQDGSA